MKYYSKYEVALAILKKLNPDIETTPKNNYEVALAVLEAIKNGGGTSSFNWSSFSNFPSVEYSLDGGSTYNKINSPLSISLPEKTKVYFRGNYTSSFTSSSAHFKVKGNVMLGGNMGSVLDMSSNIQSFDFQSFFSESTGLTEVGKDFTLPNEIPSLKIGAMFNQCTNLTQIPKINLKNVNDIGGLFTATKLKTIPKLDTSNVTNFNSLFNSCTALEEVPPLDTSKGTGFDSMFAGCSNLKTIGGVDITKYTGNSTLFRFTHNCPKLENITFNGAINGRIIDFSSSPLLTFDSVKSILTAASNTTNTNSKTLTFNRSISDVDGELAALVATCASKGWTISGLTLE